MNINTTTSNGVQHQPMRSKPRLATHSKKGVKSRRKVLHERPLMTALSREALMVEMFANQNAILLKYIKGYEKKINDLMNEKRLNNKCNKQNVEFELEEQCKTLMRDSQNQSERSEHLSGQLVFLQHMNSKLEATLRGRPGNGFNNNITEKKNRTQQSCMMNKCLQYFIKSHIYIYIYRLPLFFILVASCTCTVTNKLHYNNNVIL